MKTSVLISLAATLLSAFSAENTLPMQPSGPWQTAEGKANCMLSRDFTTNGTNTTVVINKVFDFYRIDILLLSDNAKQVGPRAGKAEITLLPTNQRYTADYALYSGRNGQQITRVSIDQDLWNRLGTASEFEIKTPVETKLSWSQFDFAQEALTACETKLKTSWGVHAEPIPRERRAVPIGDVGKFFGRSAYPPAAKKANVQGSVRTVLVINTEGHVADCRIASSANTLLDDGTCLAAKGITFDPATDASGSVVKSIYIITVNWLLNG